jgi:hypothetical protein
LFAVDVRDTEKGGWDGVLFLVAGWGDVQPRGLDVLACWKRRVHVHVINGQYQGAGKRDEPGMAVLYCFHVSVTWV